MPRSAATIIGLALVAVSIGFNIWRYPIVWRMISPVAAPAAPRAPAAVEASHPSAAASAVQPIKLPPAQPQPATPQPATPPLMLATQGEPKPVRGPASDAAPAAAERGLPASTSLEKPLVPVPRMAAVAKPIGTADAAAAVRRLPPVDPNVPTMSGSYASGRSDAIPIYPSTGIQ